MMPERANAVAEGLLARLAHSADVYVQKVDLVRETALLIQFDASAYRSASFLDDRILGPSTKGGWVAFGRVAEAARSVRNTKPLHFIFHTGHAGSTLISRLLDESGVVLSLREPLMLRSLAEAHDLLNKPESLLSETQFGLLLESFICLSSRGYDTTKCAIVKATSSAGRLAPTILTRRPAVRAIYLNLRAEPYLATLLAGQNSPIDLRGHATERMQRLQSFGAFPPKALHQLSFGELAAMSWLTETWSQDIALTQTGGRTKAIDFDRFLTNVAEGVADIVDFFGIAKDEMFLSAVAHSPALTRYSKAPEHAYTPQLRAQILADSRRNNGDEIRKGMAWLQQVARGNEVVADLVNRAG